MTMHSNFCLLLLTSVGTAVVSGYLPECLTDNLLNAAVKRLAKQLNKNTAIPALELHTDEGEVISSQEGRFHDYFSLKMDGKVDFQYAPGMTDVMFHKGEVKGGVTGKMNFTTFKMEFKDVSVTGSNDEKRDTLTVDVAVNKIDFSTDIFVSKDKCEATNVTFKISQFDDLSFSGLSKYSEYLRIYFLEIYKPKLEGVLEREVQKIFKTRGLCAIFDVRAFLESHKEELGLKDEL